MKISLAICNYKDCDKKDTCRRYNKQEKQVYDMKNACYKKKYILYCENVKDIIIKENK